MLRAEALRGRFIDTTDFDGRWPTARRARISAHLASSDIHARTPGNRGGAIVGDRIRAVPLQHDLSGRERECKAATPGPPSKNSEHAASEQSGRFQYWAILRSSRKVNR